MSVSNICTIFLQTWELGILLTDKQSVQQKRLKKLVMTYESKPFSSYLIFNKFNISLHSGILSLQKKKTPILAPEIPSATAI